MANNANNANKKTPVVKGGPQEEQQLQDMLDRLDEVHVQASLPCPEGVVVSCLADPPNAVAAASLGASAHVGAAHGQTRIA